jgi:translation elongation factor EF-Tu-like GTPase
MPPNFRARVRVRTAAEGGRQAPINVNGYRPDLRLESEEYWWGAQLVDDGSDRRVAPGETAEIDFELRTLPGVMPRLRVGTAFNMMEGQTPVADCVITHIYSGD